MSEPGRRRAFLLAPMLAAAAASSPESLGLLDKLRGEPDPLETADITVYYGQWEDIEGVKAGAEQNMLADFEHPWIGDFRHVDDIGERTENPPAGGAHYDKWQTCMGTVYDEPIENGHAIHSLEHGAVWVTYNPDQLTDAQVKALASDMEGRHHAMLSPYPGQTSAVIATVWGMQLFTDDPGDPAISAFTDTYAEHELTTPEPGATCDDGITS
ncbi:DUF3105 domain-containing protein [Salininema proteolyticum]|uniref:DUF3105 domain-containing protein n=1 Tax=Salininema proteolyticum TaxID=1607685 RepID=A0ABV8TSF7_9ACTN